MDSKAVSLNWFFEKKTINSVKDIFLNTQSFGLILILSLFLSLIISIFLLFISSKISLITGAEISNKLLKYYLNKNFLFHISTSPAKIINKVKEQTANVTGLILEQSL